MTRWTKRNHPLFDDRIHDLRVILFVSLHAGHDWMVVVNWYSLVYYECYPQMVHSRHDSLGWGDAQFQRMYCQIGRYPLPLNVFQGIGIEIEIEIDHGGRGGDNNHIHVHVHVHVHTRHIHGYGLKSCTDSRRYWQC